jgi:triosephosphate isomerase
MAGNWKMYKTSAETAAFMRAFKPVVAGATHCDIVICPAFPSLETAAAEARGTRIEIGAQNLYWNKEGAFTGEVSGDMIQAAGCRYVIVAHSERRKYFGEGEADVVKKTRAALQFGLTPIVCVGEKLEQREANRTEEVLEGQCGGGLAVLTPDEFAKVIIAYEPVWAIGTGKTATPAIAAHAHRFIRTSLARTFGDAQLAATRILYGGSVKPDNVRNLMAEEEIDGALVGGASLDPASFGAIVNFQ